VICASHESLLGCQLESPMVYSPTMFLKIEKIPQQTSHPRTTTKLEHISLKFDFPLSNTAALPSSYRFIPHTHTHSTPSATKMNKEAIDITHFELERIIGQGGFGKVYACRKKSDAGKLSDKDEWYAIKKLEKDFILKSKTGVESVFTELNSVRDLIHKNICCCQYGFLSDDAVYIVLDIAFGGDLRYALKNSKKKVRLDE